MLEIEIGSLVKEKVFVAKIYDNGRFLGAQEDVTCNAKMEFELICFSIMILNKIQFIIEF